jgi:hypothetical protein
MKKVIIVMALLLSGFIFKTATAQVHFNINIGVQPVWGPVGYDHVEYYYMPDIDVFYSVPRRQYVYLQQGRWIFTASLPSRYRGYDIYNGYKVVINDDPRPYRNAGTYRTKYAPYKGRHDQRIIRNSDDPKYFRIKDHPMHNQWEKNQNQGNGNQNKGKGNKRRNN